MINQADLLAISLTLKLAVVTTILLLVLSTPLAWWLARSRSTWRNVVLAITSLPLVLPPTVIGFYLLVMLGPKGPVGSAMAAFGLTTLPFTFAGLVVGSLFYSLPFAVTPLVRAFAAIGPRPLEVAATLRARPVDIFFSVVMPLSKAGFASAAVLTFAHTIGEFGIVLMLGGNIPGATQVISTQIYGHVEAMNYSQAHALAGLMVAFAFIVLLAAGWLERRSGPTAHD
jgi:molybdate transport system permease protein